MTEWMKWFMAGGVLVVLEMFTGTFYLLMIGAGLAAGGIAAIMGAELPGQFAVAAIIGVLATLWLRHSKLSRMERKNALRDPNVNLDIGQEVQVEQWGSMRTARVMYRGALWDVELEGAGEPVPGNFVIREIRGNRLIVGHMTQHHH
jgi:membrane protein implicated in regulation of membrane protease activity